FGATTTETRIRMLEGRRSRLEERIHGVRTTLARSRERVDSYTLELQRHGLESVEREVRWLNELIQTERGGQREIPPLGTAHTTNPRADGPPSGAHDSE
ncbi:MAG: PadR family transcriptional regulator, partial [Propionibacteriales bacterium]|nr:PadR family transcriptional regulator [Propionibacteriales bacterium]